MSGVQAKQQGQYQSAVAEQNARLTISQQQDAIVKEQQQRVQLDRKYSQIKGSQEVAMAANGVDANFGSAQQTAQDTAMFRGEDAASLAANQNSELKGFDIQAANYRSQGQAARMKGNAAFTSSLFQAAGTALSGASQYGQLKAKFG